MTSDFSIPPPLSHTPPPLINGENDDDASDFDSPHQHRRILDVDDNANCSFVEASVEAITSSPFVATEGNTNASAVIDSGLGIHDLGDSDNAHNIRKTSVCSHTSGEERCDNDLAVQHSVKPSSNDHLVNVITDNAAHEVSLVADGVQIVEDDFGDFADFVAVPVTKDDSDFTSGDVELEDDSACVSLQDADSWVAFSESSAVPCESVNRDDDGDYRWSTPVAEHWDQPTVAVVEDSFWAEEHGSNDFVMEAVHCEKPDNSECLDACTASVDEQLGTIFTLDEEKSCDAKAADEKIILDVMEHSEKASSANVWSCLRQVEETNALQLNMTATECWRCYVRCVNINPDLPNSRNPNVPVFASQLGRHTLEPLRPAAHAAGSGSIMDSGATQLSHESSTLNIDSLAVPPVEFDWRSSGLVNPLQAYAHSELLDLDYFVSNEVSSKRDSVLSKDLKNLGLDTDDDALQKASLNKASINSVLKAFAEPIDTLGGGSELSEVQEITKRLPNLSFMLSSVLMFTVKGPSDSES